MLSQTRLYFLIGVAFLLLYFGLHLILGKIPTKLKGSVYDYARKFLGLSFSAVSVSISLFYALGINLLPSYCNHAYNLSTYYVAVNFMAYSFIILIRVKPKMVTSLYAFGIPSMFLYPLPMCAAIRYGDIPIIEGVVFGSSLYLFISVVLLIMHFFSEYRSYFIKSDIYNNDSFREHLKWISTSVSLIIILGILCGVVAFTKFIPEIFLILYLCAFIGVCVYIFYKYISFAAVFLEFFDEIIDSDELPNAETEVDDVNLTPKVCMQISSFIEQWIESKSYLDPNITVQLIADQAGTNRFYLSHYINSTYKCSFRVWILNLRLTEAKYLLKHKLEMNITDISKAVGFTSIASFTRAFSQLEGVSPTMWRQLNCQ